MRRLILVAALGLVAGCGGTPRVDATDEETAKRSVAAVAASLSGKDKAEFQKKVMGAALMAPLKKMKTKLGQKLTFADAVEAFHGMTGAEVIAAELSK